MPDSASSDGQPCDSIRAKAGASSSQGGCHAVACSRYGETLSNKGGLEVKAHRDVCHVGTNCTVNRSIPGIVIHLAVVRCVTLQHGNNAASLVEHSIVRHVTAVARSDCACRNPHLHHVGLLSVAARVRNDSPGGTKIVRPPQIPYAVPWLGNTLSFLTTTPGKFWQQLFSWHPRSTGVCTLLIGGRHTHIVYSPATVQAMFKAKSPSRDDFERDMFAQVFEMSTEQIDNAANGKHFEHEMNANYMTNFARVNELTSHFTKVLDEVLAKDSREMVEAGNFGLYGWLRDRMFTASCTALFGEKLLQIYPSYCEDFFQFDADFLKFFFHFPKAMMKDASARRQRMFEKLEAWSLEMHKLSGGTPVDPEGPAWEPIFGSRLNRARQLDYKNRMLSTRSAAALDAGVTFGLTTNVIPATGWMLFHILDSHAPTSLLPRVLAEIKRAEKSDGSLDIAILMSQPLLQSIWTEALRLYTDVLVVRNLPEDITLPLDESGKLQVAFRKGDSVFAPSWLGHQDAKAWSGGEAPAECFDADRFLTKDLNTGEATFSISRTAGKFFPFGGGKTICPGRIFAKQEALGAVAMILLRFDFEVTGYKDGNNSPAKDFPGLKEAFPGSAVLVPGGDLQVKIKPRTG